VDTLRLVGIALLSLAVFAVGLTAGRIYNEKLKYTAAFISLITRLRGYIEFDRGELATLYPLCAGGDVAPLEEAGFLSDASALGWDTALEKLDSKIFLDSETKAVMVEFGGLLGKTHADEQLRNCDRALARLDEITRAQAPEAAKKAKLYRALGASAALTLALILL
jgi:Stage III sporulation protein AB (spore_III_AB).